MTLPRILALLAVTATAAGADDQARFRAMDEARRAMVAALDTRDANAFAALAAPNLETEGLWFPTAACRKRFGTTRLATAKELAALVACFAPLGVQQSGLLVTYGPGITMSVSIGVDDANKATIQKLGAFAGDPAWPEIFLKIFERHRTAGEPTILVTGAARTELAARPSGVAAAKVCVDVKGKPSLRDTVDLDLGSALGKAIAAAVRTWRFTPFTLRDKPIAACAHVFVRETEQAIR